MLIVIYTVVILVKFFSKSTINAFNFQNVSKQRLSINL